MSKFINIGFGNMVSAGRIVAIASPDSAPVKRLVQDAREDGRVIDVSCGRRTRAVIITDSDHVILSAIQTETITNRLSSDEDYGSDDEEERKKEQEAKMAGGNLGALVGIGAGIISALVQKDEPDEELIREQEEIDEMLENQIGYIEITEFDDVTEDQFAEALAEQEIPCSFEESSEFFHTMEIAVTVSLLEILDNPRQDVPLISVLRSPVFGFSLDDLAEIRFRKGKTAQFMLQHVAGPVTAAGGAVDHHISGGIQIGNTLTGIPQNGCQCAVRTAVFLITIGVQQQILLRLETCFFQN